MKKFLALLCLLPALCFGQAMTSWSEYSTIAFNADNSKRPTVIFINTVNATGACPGYDGTVYGFTPCNFAKGTWTQTSLAQFGVPETAKEVFVQGLLIITPGATAGTPDLWFQCRAPDSTLPAGSYQAQTIGQSTYVGSTLVFVGQRSTIAMWCPVKDGKIETMWNQTGPTDAYYGINLSLQAYVR